PTGTTYAWYGPWSRVPSDGLCSQAIGDQTKAVSPGRKCSRSKYQSEPPAEAGSASTPRHAAVTATTDTARRRVLLTSHRRMHRRRGCLPVDLLVLVLVRGSARPAHDDLDDGDDQ